MMKKWLACLALGMTGVASQAITPLWLRDVCVSPDGKEIAFCYKGDIYKVKTSGGEAVRLTTQSSYESSPVWSADGKQIAFASDRYGNFDVFVMSSEGGPARRLTSNSASEIPSSFTPDGKYVLFSASIQDPTASAMFPTSSMTELYRIPVGGGRTEQVLGTPAEMVNYSPSGDFFLYQDRKGYEDEWRKHHTSSVTRDVWMYNVKNGKHTNLTAHAGEDRNPVLSADGKQVYFLSERNGGTFNVYRFALDAPQQVAPVTSFRTHPVRFLSVASDNTLCYTYDGEIYTQAPGGQPTKVSVSLTRDDEDSPESYAFTHGASEAVVSPDGKQVAFVARGEVFVTSVEYGTTKQITHTSEAERGLSFGADNRTLVYASERDGIRSLYQAKIMRSEDANFPNATTIEETPLFPSSDGVERDYPQFSPDGKEIAFIEDRNRLMVLNLASKSVRQVTDGSTWYVRSGGFSFEWSPDGKWFTLEFIGNRHDPYTDIGLVKADGSSPIVNLTHSGYSSESPRWVMGGNAILFVTERYGMRAHASWGSQSDAMLCFMNQDAYDKYRLSKEDYELQKELEKEQKSEAEKTDKKSGKKSSEKAGKKSEADTKAKDINVELDGIDERMVRLTPNSSNLASAIVSEDGEKLYYLCSFEKGYDLWKTDLRKHETKLLHKMNSGWAHLESDKDGKNIFILGGESMQKMDASSESLKPVTYRAEMKMNPAAERAYMFDNACREEAARFYEVNMHGVDWKLMTESYRKFLPHINNNYDFAELMSELLGELNVSHTGGRFRPSPIEKTACLGILFDWKYDGDGIRIEEVVEKGPFDRKDSKVKSGVIIEKIDGEALKKDVDYTNLLTGKAGHKVLVSLYDPQSNQRWDEVVKPIGPADWSDLLYDRWVKQRAADVAKWSNGRLGYVHIRSMGDDSFRSVYSDILGKYNTCDGIVIDTRFNGGGRLHEDIEVLFSGKKYFTQVIRGREACDMPSRRWNKPSIMLQCEANYSNAHGTPWVYKHCGIGKLVGAPVPGTMTSVNWVKMQDPSLVYGIPVVGYRLPDGSYLENTQLEPDIYVLNSPETIVTGEDTQLKAAVDELLKEVGK